MPKSASDTIANIEAALRGEQAAMRHLFETHSEAVFSTVWRFTGDTMVAEELTQDVFLKAFAALTSYDSNRAKFSTWLQRIAYNTVISHQRQRKPPPLLSLDEQIYGDDDTSETEQTLLLTFEDEEHIEKLMEVVESLPAEERHLITLRYYDDYTLKEMAYILQLSIPAVSLRLKRINEKLYHKLTTTEQ